MSLTDLALILPPRNALAVALVLSIILFALVSNLAWSGKGRPGRHPGHRLVPFRGTKVARALLESARWLYYLGFPYLTLVLGFNTVRALGLWSSDWFGPIGWAAGLTLGTAVVLIWVWRPYNRTEQMNLREPPRWSWARRIVESLYQQGHWAFYRSGPILWLNDFYLGTFLGLGLVLIEASTNPNVRMSLRDTGRADAPLWIGSIAIATSIIFVFTENVWYCLGAHLFFDLVLRTCLGFSRRPTHETTEVLRSETLRYS